MEEKAKKIAELLKLLANEQAASDPVRIDARPEKRERDTRAHAEYYSFRAFAASQSLKNFGDPQFGKTGDECALLDQ